jgi:hypothetical protein
MLPWRTGMLRPHEPSATRAWRPTSPEEGIDLAGAAEVDSSQGPCQPPHGDKVGNRMCALRENMGRWLVFFRA